MTASVVVSGLRFLLYVLFVDTAWPQIVLPFICGLTTGITVGFVGASFPIVVSLIIAGNHSNAYFLGTMAVAFFAGYAGVLLSPVHVCLRGLLQYWSLCLEYCLLTPPSLISAYVCLLIRQVDSGRLWVQTGKQTTELLIMDLSWSQLDIQLIWYFLILCEDDLLFHYHWLPIYMIRTANWMRL